MATVAGRRFGGSCLSSSIRVSLSLVALVVDVLCNLGCGALGCCLCSLSVRGFIVIYFHSPTSTNRIHWQFHGSWICWFCWLKFDILLDLLDDLGLIFLI